MAEQTGLSYPTVRKAVTLIRTAIVSHSSDFEELLGGEVEMPVKGPAYDGDESYFGGRRKGKRGRGAANKVPVFCILERAGIVRPEVIKNVKADTLLNMTVKTVRRGSIVYTDKYKGDDAWMFCSYGHNKIDHKTLFASGKVYINGVEGFWNYAK